jgi:hypothetical protein
MFLDGQLYQRGSNILLQSETILSTSIYADYVYSCNQASAIDFTSNSIVHLRNLSMFGTLTLEGSPSVHIMGSMQMFKVHLGQTSITTTGTHQFGFTIAWTGIGAGESHMFDVNGATFMTGANVRQYHKFAALVNPTDNGATLPGLDTITDQSSMVSPSLGKSKLKVMRKSSKSVNIFVEWSAMLSGYTANMRLEVFAPIALGTLTAAPFLL